WTQLEDFPGGTRSYAYAATYGGKAYFGFGSNDFTYFFNDLWEFNHETQEWTELTSCPCAGRAHPAFVAHSGKIFVGLGGTGQDLNDWWEYDIETDQWTQRPSLPGPPRHHPFHFAAGEYVYAGFGHGSSSYYSDWYRYDLEENNWTQMNNHPAGGRVAGQEFSHNGYGYIISGDGGGHSNLAEGEFWRYEHEEDSWTRLPDHPGSAPDGRVGRWAPGAFVLKDHVYFFGGVNRGNAILFGDMYSFPLETPTPTTNLKVGDQVFKLFPNPASNYLNLEFGDLAVESLRVGIFDLQGRQVMELPMTSNRIDISELSSGLYFLQLEFDSATEVRPFIKN
nr:T9SS type A sorting domain-containing protein [Saprospiraceae bacterium]